VVVSDVSAGVIKARMHVHSDIIIAPENATPHATSNAISALSLATKELLLLAVVILSQALRHYRRFNDQGSKGNYKTAPPSNLKKAFFKIIKRPPF
jgi:hypothetical protein